MLVKLTPFFVFVDSMKFTTSELLTWLYSRLSKHEACSQKATPLLHGINSKGKKRNKFYG